MKRRTSISGRTSEHAAEFDTDDLVSLAPRLPIILFSGTHRRLKSSSLT